MDCRWVHQPPPHPLLGLMMNPCFRALLLDAISRESCNVNASIGVAPFLFKHPESEVSWHQSDLNLGQIWWLEHFSKSYNTGLLWPGKVMSCLAHLAEGPIVIVSFLVGLSILPWGNCKTYSTSCSWWILPVSKVRPCWKTISRLSRSMSMVLRFSTRTFNDKC